MKKYCFTYFRPIKVKPSKNGYRKQIIQKDTENINKLLKKQTNTFNIMLSLQWEQLDTIQFSKFLESKIDKGINVNFIIWGAFWLDEDKLDNIHYKIQLSKLTFPHSLALVIILEQIYRAKQIISWRNYHY